MYPHKRSITTQRTVLQHVMAVKYSPIRCSHVHSGGLTFIVLITNNFIHPSIHPSIYPSNEWINPGCRGTDEQREGGRRMHLRIVKIVLFNALLQCLRRNIRHWIDKCMCIYKIELIKKKIWLVSTSILTVAFDRLAVDPSRQNLSHSGKGQQWGEEALT